jgi:uncharacterized RDD family membrane protein YckC
MERQGFGIRLGAALIDLVILIVLGGIIGVIFGTGFSVRFGSGGGEVVDAATLSKIRTAGIIGSLMQIAYSLTEIFMAGSPGKQILGLRIKSETGADAPVPQLVTRWAVRYSPLLLGFLGNFIGIFGLLSGIVALVIFIGCFLTLGQNRQALHDMVAKTAVFRKAAAMIGFPVGTTAPPPPQA